MMKFLVSGAAILLATAVGASAQTYNGQGYGSQQFGNQRYSGAYGRSGNGGGAQIRLSPARVRQVQQALNQRGYNAGHVSGFVNRRLRNALMNFQQARGLAPTGTITASTINALGLNRMGGSPTYGGAYGGTRGFAGNNTGYRGYGQGYGGGSYGANQAYNNSGYGGSYRSNQRYGAGGSNWGYNGSGYGGRSGHGGVTGSLGGANGQRIYNESPQ